MCFDYFLLQIQPFEAAGASLGLTPSDVIGCSDITFSCVADPQVAKDVLVFIKLYICIHLFIFMKLIFIDGIWKLWSSF